MVGVQDERSLMLKDFAEDSAVMPQKNLMIVMMLQHPVRCGTDEGWTEVKTATAIVLLRSCACHLQYLQVPPGSTTYTRGQ
jgi:hypothetical protein